MYLNLFSQICLVNLKLYEYLIGFFVLFTLIFLLIKLRSNTDRWSKVDDYFTKVTKTLNSVRYGDLTKKLEKMEVPKSDELAESVNKMIESLSDREKMIQEYQTELYKQNKLLEAVINSLSDGLVVVDDNYKILRTTERVSDWLEVEGSKLLGKSLQEADYAKSKIK